MRPWRGLRGVLGVAALASRWVVRQPSWLIQDAVVALAFLIILYAWGGVEAARSVVAAWIVSGVWGAGVNAVGQEVGEARLFGMLDMFVASPVTPRQYLAGVLLASLPLLAPSTAVLVLLAAPLGAMGLVAPSLAAALLLLPVAVMTGLAIAMAVEKPTNIAAYTNPATILLTLLPPVFYPLKALPPWLRPAALLAPTASAAELARALAGYHNAYTWHIPLAALAAWNAAALAAARKLIRWGAR